MKLKYLVILPIAALLLSSCGESDNTDEAKGDTKTDNSNNDTQENATGNVSISGTVSDGSGSMIYLYKYGVNPPLTLDSAKLDENGSFSFNTENSGYNFVGVGFQMNNAALLLIGNEDEVQLSGSMTNWVRDHQISGTGYSADIRGYMVVRQEFTDKINALKTEMAAIPKTDKVALEKINEKGMALQEEFTTKRDQFIDEHDDTPALYIALQDIYDPIADVERVNQIAKATNKYMPNTMFSDQVNTLVSQVEQQLAYEEQQATSAGAVAIGKPAPELSFATPDGKNLSLSSLKGNVVLLDFWASWCKPCRMENPNVVNLYNQYKDKGFTVYSVSLDNNKAQWMNAIQADGLAWPNHVSDLGGWNSMPAAIYGVNSIPQTYLIDADGTIIAKDLRGEALASKLKEILG